VADLLGIPFYLVNVAMEFREWVVDYFVSEYAAGRTPNPCIECNRQIRFGLLLRRALALDAVYLASGHYARIRHHDGRFQLCRGVDPKKDQSYFLHVLGQRQLARVLFPLGNYTKGRVRALAKQYGLPVAERSESQDLCFVGNDGYRSFLADQISESVHPGPIRDTTGRILGTHPGLVHYTVGQRKGINVGSPEPLYVIALDPTDNTLIIGTASELGRNVCFVHHINWVDVQPPADAFEATAKIRYKAPDTPVRVNLINVATARVEFSQSQRDVAPGQALVLYQREVVLGGGVISWTE
jgi:tRNA-specific 2-thiouridylase